MRRGYINFYAVYIGWLCSAVFLHLPSFQALGLDVRTDLSVLLTIFLLSLLVRPAAARACLLPGGGRGRGNVWGRSLSLTPRSWLGRCWARCMRATCCRWAWERWRRGRSGAPRGARRRSPSSCSTP